MKNILKSLAVLFAGLSMAAACAPVDNLATSISADKTALTFEAVSPAAQNLNITADGEWYVFAPSWVTVTPSHGEGNTAVKVEASANTNEWSEAMAPRSEVLKFWSSDKAAVLVEVKQNGESGLDATRNFTKITKKDEWDPTKASMIVFELSAGSFSSLLPWKGDTESKYAYLTVTPVKPVDGVITYSNSSLAYTFVKKGDGYALLQSNNYYLFGSGSYSSFYSTTSLDKADEWSVDFDADGHALLKNETAGRYIHYSENYGNVEELPAAEAILPYLFQDKAAASNEVLYAESTYYLNASATTVSIPVTANCEWIARNHDSWIKSFTKSGNNDGTIEVTFEPNTGADRTASIQIIGKEKNITVELVQSAPIATVEALNTWIASGATCYEIACKDVLVTYVNGNNAFLQDETAGILLYLKSHGLKKGDKINGTISGVSMISSGINEITSFSKGANYASTSDNTVTPVTVTLADFNKNSAKYVSMLVNFAGVEVTAGIDSDVKEGTVTVGEASAKIYNKASAVVTKETKGDLVAIPYINNGAYFLGIWESSFMTSTFIGGAITASNVSVDAGSSVAIGAKINTGATMTYVSEDTTIATVDESGNVTGVKVGETNIKITAPAGTGYSAAEKTIKVTVNKATPKIILTDANFPTSYGTDAALTGAANFKCTNVANYGNGIQFKSQAYLYNTAAIGKKITKITLEKTTKKTFYNGNYKLWVGTSADALTTEIKYTQGESKASDYFDLSGGNYTFFKLVNNYTGACYMGKITIAYEE